MSTASASSRPTTCTSGTCFSASRSTARRRRPATTACWAPTSRTVMTTSGGWSPRARHGGRQAVARLSPRAARAASPSSLGGLEPARRVRLHPERRRDLLGRMLRYLVTSPLRRATELQNLSAYDFFVGTRRRPAARRFTYTPHVRGADPRHAQGAGRVRLALGRRPHQHHHLSCSCYLQMDRRDNKADGVLNGPTTESWFDHWYRHLVALGVRFVPTGGDRLDPPAVDRDSATPPAAARAGRRWPTAPGWRRTTSVVAVDAPDAERITARAARGGHRRRRGRAGRFRHLGAPADGPLQPEHDPARRRRDPYAMAEMGRVPWDRFQTLGGIQYYFDTEFQLVRGHVLLLRHRVGAVVDQPARDCGRSGRSWPATATSRCSRSTSATSTRPSQHLVDEHGRGKAARDCTADELAAEVWRQIVAAITERRSTIRRGSDHAVARLVRARPEPGHGRRSRPGRRSRGPQRGAVPRSRSSATGRTGPAASRGTRTARPGSPGRPRTGGSTTSSTATSGRPATAATRCTTTRWSSRAPGPRRSPG